VEKGMKAIPGVSQRIEDEYAEIMVELESSTKPYKNKFASFTQIPETGRSHADVLSEMESMRAAGRNHIGKMALFRVRFITETRNTLIF